MGRLERDSVYVNATEKAYTRHLYAANGIQRQSYTPIVDADGDGNISEDEVLSESWHDGAGRTRFTRTEHPNSTTEWMAVKTTYDILGRVITSSVPTEINPVTATNPDSWVTAGDDYRDGVWLVNSREYDWMSRVKRTIPSDSTGSDNKDTLIEYAGCGCAGSLVTTIKGPVTTAVDAGGTTQTTKRRWTKVHEDILGRTFKQEIWDLDGAGMPSVGGAYSTVKTTFNRRDQATLVRQYQGSDSSSTYQDTTMSFDGHGRMTSSHKPEQTDFTTPKYTTYTHNPDGSVLTSTDARGVITSYTYNSRALPTVIAWNVGTTGVTDTTDVTFSYDNIGNRIQMTDGLGTQSYAYNSLSQLTSEKRIFSDTLADKPTGDYVISYEYGVAGQLASYTDPWGKEIEYTQDKIGRLRAVNGTSFGGVTNYSQDGVYRAWGAAKSREMAGVVEMNASYNNRLQVSAQSFFSISNPSIKTFDRTYSYHNDGVLSLIDENVTGLDKFDRSFTYDFASRIKYAKSGIEAHGQTETNLYSLPYRQTYTHNTFGNLTERDSTLWNYTTGDWDFEYYMINNRNQSASYDSDGRQTQDWDFDIDFFFDAAGRMDKTSRYQEYETLLYQDGNGKDAKRSQRTWNLSTQQWNAWETVYFVNSSVLGKTLSETTGTGKKKHTYVFADGSAVARQDLSATNVESIAWQFNEASGYSARGFNDFEKDALGNNVGIFPMTPRRPDNSMTTGQSPFHNDMGMGDCDYNGIFVPCSLAQGMHDELSPTSGGSSLPVQVGTRNAYSKTGSGMPLTGNALYLEFTEPDTSEVDLENWTVTVTAGATYILLNSPPSSQPETSTRSVNNSGCSFRIYVALSPTNPPTTISTDQATLDAAKTEISRIFSGAGHRVRFDLNGIVDTSYSITLVGGVSTDPVTGLPDRKWATGTLGSGFGRLFTGFMSDEAARIGVDANSQTIGTAMGRIIAHESILHNFLERTNLGHTEDGVTREILPAAEILNPNAGYLFNVPGHLGNELNQLCKPQRIPDNYG